MRDGESIVAVSHTGEPGEWTMAFRRPHASLRGLVQPYRAYAETSYPWVCRRETPAPIVPLIINLGAPLRVGPASDGARRAVLQSPFVAGLHRSSTFVEASGLQRGIQVNFSPIGARLFFGVAMDELANRVVDLEDVLGAAGRDLVDRLREAPAACRAFDTLDDAIRARIAAAEPPCDAIAWAWTEILRSGGNVDLRAMACRLEISPRHFIARCREELGLPPKLLARIVRFARARRLLERRNWRSSCAAIADECGYFDQAHFTREFHEFAGVTPRQYLAARMPDGRGVSAEPLA